MNNDRDTRPTVLPEGRSGRAYHHGDLRNGLLEAARTILEEESLSALTLRATIPGIDEAKFRQLAEAAEKGCPISKLLNTEITLDATLG